MDFLRDGYLKRYFKIVPTILFLLIFESANSSIGDLEISWSWQVLKFLFGSDLTIVFNEQFCHKQVALE